MGERDERAAVVNQAASGKVTAGIRECRLAVISMHAAAASLTIQLRARTVISRHEPVAAKERHLLGLDGDAPSGGATGMTVPAGVGGVCVQREDARAAHLGMIARAFVVHGVRS